MGITLPTGRIIGPGHPTYVVAEIGINHNGDMLLVEELINHAKHAGADAVKFQMRTVDVVYTAEELAKPRQSPFGETNGDLKRGLELSVGQYHDIDAMCREAGLDWSASPWDVAALERLMLFDPPWIKVAGPCVTDEWLIRDIAATKKPVFLSTGMSTPDEIHAAYSRLGGRQRCVPMHCVSSYPTVPQDARLAGLKDFCLTMPLAVRGYSGHEIGTAITLAAVALNAHVIERHITASRSLWGSDQAWSLEPGEFAEMVKGIREIEAALQGECRTGVYDCERAAWEKLRRFKGENQEVTSG